MLTFEELAHLIYARGCETGGRLDTGCFYCGGDDIEYPYTKQARATGTIIHEPDCLFLVLKGMCDHADL